jgi:hypothetical protein
MKKMPVSKSRQAVLDEMLPEYNLDYRKAKPNRFASRYDQERIVVILDPDISRVFTTPESVNTALRALITAMPHVPKRKAAVRKVGR